MSPDGGPRRVAQFTAVLVTCGACTLLSPLSGLSSGAPGVDVTDAAILDASDAASAPSGPAGPDGLAPVTPLDAATEPRRCPCTLFGDAFTGVPSYDDNGSTEVGVRFRSDVAGKIVGLRYYRGLENLGGHIGSLWTEGGVLLTSATFTNETSSGWQSTMLAGPVPIEAGTWYVASYRATLGHYSAQASFFAKEYDAPPLHGAASGGLFTYDGGVPSQTFMDTNYWVDVVFEP